MSSASSAVVAATSGTTGMIPLIGESAPERVLVKFTFANQTLIPDGVPEKERGSDAEVDARHAAVARAAGAGSLGEKGRVRNGRVDTGEQVINCNDGTSADFIRRGLVPNGYRLTRVHWYERKDKNSPKKKYTVVLQYDRVNEILERPWLDRALRDLATARWDWVNVWDNPDGTVTCNFSGRSNANAKPTWNLGVHNKCLMLLPAT